MRNSVILLCLALAACLANTQAASYRRGDKISEHFKQLDLPPEEIDPNVAPLDSMNEVIFDNEVLDQAEEQSAAAAELATEDSIIEEVGQSVATTPAAVASAPVTNAPAATTAAAATEATTTPVKGEDESVLAKYCKCSGNHCDCCRAFNLPFIPIKGPGCARMSYLGNEKMSVSLKYGDLTLITRTVSSKRARPICVGLPGGYSQFCGRIYGLSRASENFKACLGFELRADDEVEAALRVSCFKFGPEGLKVAEAEPLPSEANKQQEDDDDDDIFGFAAGGDDEDDDEDDYDEENDDEEEADDDEEADTDYADDDAEVDEAPADADYGGFSLAGLLAELDDDDEDETKPSSTPATAIAAAASPVAATATDAATRNADAAQSKDEKGTESTDATQMMDDSVAASTIETSETPASENTSETTGKTKKAKKAKKNKKKKAADAEGGFAYELLNGLLDFFN
ncbi:uncharacterized protein LOC142229747 [Haematobia irritans]|uniref:uncharacterized protein LOC142229747 n=1 Tax=Haematobia irritans TaxID=7368 RepID=UPI003F4FCF99